MIVFFIVSLTLKRLNPFYINDCTRPKGCSHIYTILKCCLSCRCHTPIRRTGIRKTLFPSEAAVLWKANLYLTTIRSVYLFSKYHWKAVQVKKEYFSFSVAEPDTLDLWFSMAVKIRQSSDKSVINAQTDILIHITHR